ncbi:hypothetical protein D3C71_1245140 [compost metagenome]
MRANCKAAAAASAANVAQPAGANTHNASPTAVLARALRSSHCGTVIFTPGFTLMVNAGMTRPAITHSTITIRPKAAYNALVGAIATQPMIER